MKAPMDANLDGGWEAGAAEYSLGLMPRDEIAAFEAGLMAEPDLQQDVGAWTEYFASFTDLIPAESPPPQVLRRLEGRVFGVVEKAPIWHQLLPYLVGAVIGVVIAWGVFASGLLEPSHTVLSADLVGEDASLALEARFDSATGVLTVARKAGAAAEGRVLELWLISDDAGPVSLALLRSRETLVALPTAVAQSLSGAQLLVSEEPAGGAPEGVPSGDKRAEGQLAQP